MSLKKRIGSLRKSIVREALEGFLGIFKVASKYWLALALTLPALGHVFNTCTTPAQRWVRWMNGFYSI